jgi:hypothetical protein
MSCSYCAEGIYHNGLACGFGRGYYPYRARALQAVGTGVLVGSVWSSWTDQYALKIDAYAHLQAWVRARQSARIGLGAR